ncbi:hypothetical protein GCM10027073_14620 [Streptomyces chlorus]
MPAARGPRLRQKQRHVVRPVPLTCPGPGGPAGAGAEGVPSDTPTTFSHGCVTGPGNPLSSLRTRRAR